MFDALLGALSGESFMPHGHCYLWQPALVWIQLLSNLAIGLAYVAIACTLVYMVRRIEDLPFKLVYVCFAVFIVTCGFTHFMDAYVIWNPVYWIDGGIRIVTAIASVGTAVLLPPLIPDAVALARGARAAHKRGVKLEAMVEDLETMYEQVKTLEQQKTDFFANISHELRTPLQLILGPAEKLSASQNLEPKERERVETIVRNGRVLLKHVNDLLDVASMEAGRLEVAYREFDLAKEVRRLASNFETVAEQKNIDLVVEVPERLPAEMDLDKFESVLLNLLSNAFKFAPDGGTVRCTVEAIEAELRSEQDQSEDDEDDREEDKSEEGARPHVPGRRVKITVADSGPGVAPADREAIFERFRQLDSGSTRRFGGTGLGLVITRDFVEMHHGDIAVDQAPEGGALFRVELPLEAPEGAYFKERDLPEEDEGSLDEPQRRAQGALAATASELAHTAEKAEADERRKEGAFEAHGEEAQGERPLVLVVEDNPDMAAFITETLGDVYRTTVAYDGRQGLEMALELEPDLIVSDIMMPEMSGDQMVREVRTYARLDAVPILLLTAKADDALRLELLREGAQDYVMKPFETEELRARVANQVTISRARKLLQDELHSTRRDLEHLVGELAQSRRELVSSLEINRVALERAEKASELKSGFLGMVSHELRTPVAALQLQVAVLEEDDSLSEQGKKMLTRMESSITRLTQLIESLLHRASIESGQMAVADERFDPAQLVEEVAEELNEEAQRRGLVLGTSVELDVGDMVSDPRMLRLILANLVRNALRYTSEGHVELQVSRDGGRYRFSVSDTGPGIAPEDRVRLFSPFERGEDARERQLPGVGLGLALVRDLAEALGGNIELETEVGAGSIFTVVLPSGSHADFSDDVSHE